MPTLKRRNHYIPQFLLRRFASRADEERNKHWIWQFSRESDPKEISTRDAGVSARFYGHDNTDIEDPFSQVEGDFASVLQAIDRAESPDSHNESLRSLCWFQAIRTRAIRLQACTATDEFLSKIEEAASEPDTIVELKQYISSNFNTIVLDAIRDEPAIRRNFYRILLHIPPIKRILVDKFISVIDCGDYNVLLSGMINNLKSGNVSAKAIKSGQLRGLRALLESNKVPDTFNPTSWGLVKGVAGSVILGDGCVVCLGEDGEIGSIMRYGAQCPELYLPISDDSVLVALNGPSRPTLDLDDINLASASLSLEFMWSAKRDENATTLAKLIGTRAPIYSETELADFAKQGFKDFVGEN